MDKKYIQDKKDSVEILKTLKIIFKSDYNITKALDIAIIELQISIDNQ